MLLLQSQFSVTPSTESTEPELPSKRSGGSPLDKRTYNEAAFDYFGPQIQDLLYRNQTRPTTQIPDL